MQRNLKLESPCDNRRKYFLDRPQIGTSLTVQVRLAALGWTAEAAVPTLFLFRL